MLPPTTRFSSRVADYVRSRPGYPNEILTALEELIGFRQNWHVADVGSGTGKLAELLLEYGCHVTGIEPNKEMREAGDEILKPWSKFSSIDGTAENTGLDDHAYDLITAGQAFHWFEPESAKKEFRRILKEDGWVALIWNDRQVAGTPFLESYDRLLRQTPEYGHVGHKIGGAMKIKGFFKEAPIEFRTPSKQEFDWDGLFGRALSSSYVPVREHPDHNKFVSDLKNIFDTTQENGKVTFLYETQMFLGQV